MAYVITELCERAGLCVDVCPTGSIHTLPEPTDEWPLYYINPDTCIDCGACMAECPNEAIFVEDDVPDKYVDDIKKNVAFFETGPGKDMV